MKLLLLALASLYVVHGAVPPAVQNQIDRQNECVHPKMPGFHALFPDPLGLPCDMQAIEDARTTDKGFFLMIGYFVGLVYVFSGMHIVKVEFWQPSWNALLSFLGMGVSASEVTTDHYATFANCIGQFYIAVIATLLTRSTIGMSILVGSCVIEVWIIAGLGVLFNPGGANLGNVRFDLFKDILFHAASITAFFFFTGFMEPPETVLAQAKAAQAAGAAEAAGQAGATGDAAAAAAGTIDVAEWFLVLGLFGIWISYTLIVFMENTCCHSCLASEEVEDDQDIQARIEEKAGESIRGGKSPPASPKGGNIDVENKDGKDYPDVPNRDVPQEESAEVKDDEQGDLTDAQMKEAGIGVRGKSVTLWDPPESFLSKVKWLVCLPYYVVFTFTIPTFRDEEDSTKAREILWADIPRVIVANFLVNFWMIIFSIVVVQWGCIIGAVLDFEYDIVGLCILATGMSFDSLLGAMYCSWSDSDTSYQLSEGFAAQVNNFTFTLGCIMSVYMIQEGEQMPVYDGLRFCMVLLAGAAVCLFVFLRIRSMEATPVLGCLMVEFGLVVAGILVYVVHEKPNFHMTWN